MKVAIHPTFEKGALAFEIVGEGHKPWPPDFEAEAGTISKATAICPSCGTTIDSEVIHRLFQTKAAGERMIAVALARPAGQTP
jgi:hypothetical protein